MQIKELNIENFKGITSLVIKPTKINIIVGKNNTGKTSLLEAIDLLFNNEDFSRFGINLSEIINNSDTLSEIKAKINNGDIKELDLRIEKGDFIEGFYKFKSDIIKIMIEHLKEFNVENPKNVEKELDKQFDQLINEPEIKILLSNNLEITRGKTKEIIYELDYRKVRNLDKIIEHIFREQNQIVRKLLNRYVGRGMFFRTYDTINKDKKVYLIRNLLTNIKNRRFVEKENEVKERIYKIEKLIKEKSLIKNLERLDFDYVLLKEGNPNKSVPFSFLGDGFKALVGLLWELSSDNLKNNIILLDEPDIYMHPGYINELIKIILTFSMDFNIQFFIVTHNSDFISEIIEGEFTKEQKKFLEKEFTLFKMDTLKGLTTVDKANYKEAIDIRENLLLDLRGT